MSVTAAQLIVLVGADIADMESKLKRASSGFQGFSDGLISNGARMTALVSMPLYTLGQQAVKATMDFDTNLSVLRATSGASVKEMADLRQLAVDLGNDLTLPGTSAADAAEAMLELSKSGLSVKNVMAGVRGVLEMSAAGNLGNAAAAEIASNALNAFGLEGEETARVADLLAASANASSAEVTDVADSLKMAAAVAASANIPIEDLVTMIGEMANAGIKGSDAGTSLKQMILSLQAPTDKAKNLMEELGITIYNASGEMLPVKDIIGRFSSALGGLTQEQRNVTLATIFGADAVRAANVVLMGGVDAYDKMKSQVTENGAAAELAAARMEGLGGSFQRLQNAIQDAQRLAVEPFKQDLINMVDGAANLVTEFSKMGEGSRKSAVEVGLMAAAAGPTAIAIGNVSKGLVDTMLVMSQMPSLFKDANDTVRLLASGMSLFDVAALSAGGLALAIGSVAAAIVAGAAVWWQWDEQITKTNEKGTALVGQETEAMARRMRAQGKDITEIVGAVGNAHKEMSKTIADSGYGLFIDQQKLAKQELAGLGTVVRDMSGTYEEYVDQMILAANATGYLSVLTQERDSSWRENADVLGYLQQELGLVTEEQYKNAYAARYLAQASQEGAQASQYWEEVERRRREENGPALAAQLKANEQKRVEAAQIANLKNIWEEYGTAVANLEAAQKNWKQGAGNEVVGFLKEANLGSETYLQALTSLDEVYGTGFANQERQTQQTKKLVDEFKRTGDVKAFEDGLKNMRGQFEPLDEDVQQAYNQLQKLYDKIQTFKWVQINISASVNGGGNYTNPTSNGNGGYVDPGTGSGYGPGGANGLDIIVPPGYPNDTYPVRASSGERVVILTQDQVGNGAGGVNITMYNTINSGMDVEEMAFQMANIFRGRA